MRWNDGSELERSGSESAMSLFSVFDLKRFGKKKHLRMEQKDKDGSLHIASSFAF